MRSHQDWSRVEIHDRSAAIPAELDEIKRALDAAKRDTTLGQPQSLRIRIDLGKRSLALLEEESELRVELQIRDDPEKFNKCGGPGRD
jgi:hypothetical protein